MPPIEPSPDHLPDILARIPDDTPIVMLNLLRFREIAQYQNGAADYSGEKAYRLYSQVAGKKIEAAGGALLWAGRASASVIAPENENWDQVLLVRYPSIGAFTDMLADPEYQTAARHRRAALADARLIATQDETPDGPSLSQQRQA